IFIWICEIARLTESQQRITVRRERRGLFPGLLRYTRIVEDRVPDQIRNKHLQQGRAVTDRITAKIIGQPVVDPGERLFERGQINRAAPVLRLCQRVGQFPEGLRIDARRQMVDVVVRLILLVDRDYGFGDEVYVDYVHFVHWAKGKRGQSGEEH